MTGPRFHHEPEPLDLVRLIEITGAVVAGDADRLVSITGVAALDWAGPSEIAYAEDERDADALAASAAGACLVAPRFAALAPESSIALVSDEPGRAFARVAGALFPAAARPQALFGAGVAPGASVHPEARLEPDVSVDPGAVIGPGAEIGRGAIVGANVVIGAGVRLGRDSAIGPGATVANALIGDRVVIHAGAAVGHGDGADARLEGALPLLGRVVLQDGVEIGPNATVARGRIGDTVVGEATRIGALANVGPDAMIGRCCVIFAHHALGAGSMVADFSSLGLRAGSDRQRRRADGALRITASEAERPADASEDAPE
ncbi:LpxD N-terminal domain-containing protein [Hansschlegelia zhihuaiae]|uniref:UDP-3-O-(3-hydroxymyristoyl)glucosamine N-acyltransferase n=1 Tax=Hansschlegelia zhihuaiae TaxID=405005 RepID=A0A4Q0MM94_9HYPH|nr:LpxD N-terminal domain-containing protein [Hansschlegelia zhihuaiae]RXF74693.1 UDP-3-O-(3-hydroxymyristoyl)glucosamine N-acyltransferase [Hansschlegelia zhihuaiae]